METFHRLAGMTETSDNTTTQPSQPAAIPQDSEDAPNDSNRASRVSLPLNRRASHKSFHSGRSASRDAKRTPIPGEGGAPPLPPFNPTAAASQEARRSQDTGDSGSEEDFEWGPSHPCFPHPNPHCAPEGDEFRSTRVIRVRRDWLQAGDLYPQYANLYPEILDPLVSDEDFRFLVSNINARLKETFDPYSTRATVDAVLGVLTGYMWETLGMTGAKKGMKALETFVDKWNAEKARKEQPVKLVQLRRTGFMALDFVVPDPHIDMVGEEQMVEGEGGIGPAE